MNAARPLSDFTGATDAEEQPRDKFSLLARETVNAGCDQALFALGKQPATMSTGKRLKLTALHEERGISQMKGAAKQVAERIGVSPHTIYNYLITIRRKSTCRENGGEHEQSYSN